MVCFQRILMPVDADRYPEEVVEAALSLARLSGGNITALCVASGDETEALAACSVGRAAEAGAAAGIGIDPATSDGDPSEIIIERSRDHDVIVMGSGRKKLLSDSTANTVVRSAHCPVIVVRPQR
jgi:nucleotide-binding universal stress UspA family protein